MSPIMFLLGTLLGLAAGLAVFCIKAKRAPQGPPYQISSGMNGVYDFVFDQTYIGDLLAREVCRMLGLPEGQFIDSEINYTIANGEGGNRLTVTVKATKVPR